MTDQSKHQICLFTGDVVKRTRRVRVGSRGLKHRTPTGRQISGVCTSCGKGDLGIAGTGCLPFRNGWKHYKCYLDDAAQQHHDALTEHRLYRMMVDRVNGDLVLPGDLLALAS